MLSKVRIAGVLCILGSAAPLASFAPPAPDFGPPGSAGAGLALRGDSVGARPRIDGARLLADLGALAHDSMEGRRAGTAGAERARRFVVRALGERNVPPLGAERTQPFALRPGGDSARGVNVLGAVTGTVHPDRYLLVTAHYDHLGVREREVFNGADDNASGTAALIALAGWFREHPARHSVVFVALDAEEAGLQGARAFLDAGLLPGEDILLNVNLDMVSRSEAGELYVAGTFHRPWLSPLVEEAGRVSGIDLIPGHDSPDLPASQDWTLQSDHGVFHEAGIPFLYFGVEDHPDYHQPGDDASEITPAFYVEATETVLDVLLLADARGEEILRARSTGG